MIENFNLIPWDPEAYLIAADYVEEQGKLLTNAIRNKVLPLDMKKGNGSGCVLEKIAGFGDGLGEGCGKGSGSGFGNGFGGSWGNGFGSGSGDSYSLGYGYGLGSGNDHDYFY